MCVGGEHSGLPGLIPTAAGVIILSVVISACASPGSVSNGLKVVATTSSTSAGPSHRNSPGSDPSPGIATPSGAESPAAAGAKGSSRTPKLGIKSSSAAKPLIKTSNGCPGDNGGDPVAVPCASVAKVSPPTPSLQDPEAPSTSPTAPAPVTSSSSPPSEPQPVPGSPSAGTGG